MKHPLGVIYRVWIDFARSSEPRRRGLMGSSPRGIVLLLSALLWTLSCSSASTATPVTEPTPTPSPRQVIEKSGARMLALDTIRFTLEHVGGGDVELFPGVEWQRMEGQVDMPDRLKVRVEATSTFPRSFIDISIVAIGDQAFIRDFINKEKWHQVSVDTLPLTLPTWAYPERYFPVCAEPHIQRHGDSGWRTVLAR